LPYNGKENKLIEQGLIWVNFGPVLVQILNAYQHTGKMEKSILNICKKNIQEKIGVNKPDGILGNSDFEYISFLIEEKTKVRLSISTLKRIWND